MSMTTTQISVREERGPRELRMRLTSQFHNREEARRALCDILDRYASWNDRLSLALSEWGFEVLDLAHRENPMEGMAERIAAIWELLCNPLDDGVLLQEPYLAGGEVWEKWMLEEYVHARSELRLDLRSPFDSGQTLDRGEPHAFAAAILRFMATLPIARAPESGSDAGSHLVRSVFQAYPPAIKVMILYEKAMRAKARWEAASSEMRRRRLVASLEGRVSAAVEEVRREVQAMRMHSESNIEAIQTSYHEASNALHEQVHQAQENLQREHEENTRNATRASQAEAAVRALQGRVAQLENRVDDSPCVIL